MEATEPEGKLKEEDRNTKTATSRDNERSRDVYNYPSSAKACHPLSDDEWHEHKTCIEMFSIPQCIDKQFIW